MPSVALYMLIMREIEIGLGGGKSGGARPLMSIRIHGKTVSILARIWIASAIATSVPFVLQFVFTPDSAADVRVIASAVVFGSTILAPIVHAFIETDDHGD